MSRARDRGRKGRLPVREKAPNSKAYLKRQSVEGEIITVLEGEKSRGFKTRSLYNLLGRPVNYGEFESLLEGLEQKGRIVKGEMRRWFFAEPEDLVLGHLSLARSGHGFLLPVEGVERVFVHRRFLEVLLPDDLLEVQIVPSSGAFREGRPIRLRDRKLARMVARLFNIRGRLTPFADSPSFGGEIVLQCALPKEAKEGDRLILDLDCAQDLERPELLNARPDRLMALKDEAFELQESVKVSHNLPREFPQNVLDEVRSHSQKDITAEHGRQDLRDRCIFTIDPSDARDFDDALSIRPLPSGGWELGVHIADVSHFVKSGTRSDEEAYERGNSIYLPGEVIPMLPEELSAGLCSLSEGVDRFAFSAFMQISESGDLKRSHFTPSIICSAKRMSYEEAGELLKQPLTELDHESSGNQVVGSSYVVHESLLQLNRLFPLLRKKRLQQGGLDMVIPEPKFKLDALGQPLAIIKKIPSEANFLVEECMLLANQAVALELSRAQLPCVYRVHESPSGDKLQRFTDLLSHMDLGQVPDLTQIKGWQEVLARGEKAGKGLLLKELVLRSMMKARYSTDNVGHFGLGFTHYAHFTSPIRRYPDLLVHRLLRDRLCGEAPASTASLERASAQASRREIVAQVAERDAVRIKQLLYLRDHMGDEFEGMVRGVESFGLFVELTDLLTDGRIGLRDLPRDQWTYNEARWQLVGRKTGQVFEIGTLVRVQILRVDIDERRVDLKWLSGDMSDAVEGKDEEGRIA